MRQDQDFQDGHDVVGPSASSGWQLGCAVTSDWPWDSPVVGTTLIGQVPLRPLWGWPNLVLEGHLPMGHACWHAQGCRLLVLARMGLLEAWRATIVGSCVVTSASERVGWSLFELWGGLLSAIVLRPSNP